MPSLFARRRARSAAAVSKVIRQLLDLGLIAVGIAEGDARQRRYTLTAAGRAAMETVRKDRERAIARIWADFEPAALARFTDFAAQLADRMEGHARRGEPQRPQNENGPPERASSFNVSGILSRRGVRSQQLFSGSARFFADRRSNSKNRARSPSSRRRTRSFRRSRRGRRALNSPHRARPGARRSSKARARAADRSPRWSATCSPSPAAARARPARPRAPRRRARRARG